MTSRYQRTSAKGRFLTKRDQQILLSVYEARYLSTSQIRRLFFSSATRVKARLRILFDNGWLVKRDVGQNHEDVYFLGVRGKHFIEREMEQERPYVAKVAGVKGQGLNHMLFLEHDLAISGLYVALRLEAGQHDFKLSWKNARMLEILSLGVQPDAYLKIEGSKGSKEAFIEYTQVLPSRSEMRRKIEGYQKLWQSLRPIPVMWLTTSEKKLQWLSAYAVEGIMLGLYEDRAEMLTGTIWQHQGKKTAFLRPKSTVLYARGSTVTSRAGGRS